MIEDPAEKGLRIARIRPAVAQIQGRVERMDGLSGDGLYLKEAVLEACKAALQGNYGIGAVVVQGGRVVGRGHNRLNEEGYIYRHVAHAEIEAIADFHRNVCKGGAKDPRNSDDEKTTVFTTLEPCPLCTSAMLNAGIRAAVAGAADPWAGTLISFERGEAGVMSPLWRELLKSTTHRVADESAPQQLKNDCNGVFMVTKEALDNALGGHS